MFDLLVLQCKTEIYKFRFLKQPWYAIVLVVILMVAGLGTVLFSFFLENMVGFGICYGFVIVDTALVYYVDRRRNKQANAFAAYLTGKTASEVSAIGVTGEHSAPDVADLAASCTMNVVAFIDAVGRAMA